MEILIEHQYTSVYYMMAVITAFRHVLPTPDTIDMRDEVFPTFLYS